MNDRYKLEKVYVQKYFSSNRQSYSKSDINIRSELIRNFIDKFSIDNDILFLDTTETLKINSIKKEIYGPKDYNHPNKFGYEVISDYIFKNIKIY